VLFGLVAAAVATSATAGAAAIAGRTGLAAPSVLVGAGAGSGICLATFVMGIVHRRARVAVALVAGLAAAAASVFGIGLQSVGTLALGVRAGCTVGLGRCLPTGRPDMPVLVQSGPVQRRPVVRVIFWGATTREHNIVGLEESRVTDLAQPLLEDAYHSYPGVDGGSFAVPGRLTAWLRFHHQPSLRPADIRGVIARARQATGWPDTPDTQWWLVTNATPAQMGLLRGDTCADHTVVAGVKGTVDRFPFGSCRIPTERQPALVDVSCPPLAVPQPARTTPPTLAAAMEVTIDHEYAEAATDPRGGYNVVVAPRCDGYSLLEIADVCAAGGPFVSAPDYRTGPVWQPSMFEPERGRTRAHCVNPARPRMSRHT
jgi:hypothetical protein